MFTEKDHAFLKQHKITIEPQWPAGASMLKGNYDTDRQDRPSAQGAILLPQIGQGRVFRPQELLRGPVDNAPAPSGDVHSVLRSQARQVGSAGREVPRNRNGVVPYHPALSTGNRALTMWIVVCCSVMVATLITCSILHIGALQAGAR